jgi:hypothetical protein
MPTSQTSRSSTANLQLSTFLTAPDRRAGDGVAAEGGVEVEEDAGVLGRVELGGGHAGGQGFRAAAVDLDVEALGVGLGSVGAAGGVKGDDLVAQDVVAWGQTGGDLDVRREVLRDEGVRHPGAGVAAG